MSGRKSKGWTIISTIQCIADPTFGISGLDHATDGVIKRESCIGQTVGRLDFSPCGVVDCRGRAQGPRRVCQSILGSIHIRVGDHDRVSGVVFDQRTLTSYLAQSALRISDIPLGPLQSDRTLLVGTAEEMERRVTELP